jgi:NifU-like protein involved in Fe-S cluster formation
MNYSQAVLQRVREPKHVGWLPRDAPDVGTGEAGALDSGTMTRIQVRIVPETQRVEEAVFKVFGCSAAIASASLVTERMQGATVEHVKLFDPLAVVAELELPIERANVAAIAVEAAKRAVSDWERRTKNEELRTKTKN